MVWSVRQVRDLLAPGLWAFANRLRKDADIIADPVGDNIWITGDGLDFTISRKELDDNTFKVRFRDEMAAWVEREGPKP